MLEELESRHVQLKKAEPSQQLGGGGLKED
jgi:hypothetical protein